VEADGASFDSRSLRPGELFVPLLAARDGHEFVAAAVAAGAAMTLASRPVEASITVVEVADTAAALLDLAAWARQRLSATVVGITGSVGKTSTKDLVRAAVGAGRRVAANERSFNNEQGLPVTVLGAPDDTEVLVLEMGMRGFGQIGELARIARPDVGVITNVGPVHLEQVGSLAGVARAKGELLADVRVGVVPADEPLLEPYLPADVIRFGPGADVALAQFDAPRAIVAARGRRLELDVGFTASHQLTNLLAAVAAALAVGVEPRGRIEARFGALRGEHVALPGGAVLINDCYNANPLSMRAALDDLATQEPAGGRRIAVLGDMLELGTGEAEAHREVGAHAARTGVDVLVTVGPRAAAMTDRFGGEAHSVPDAAAAASLARELLEPGDLVLVKASRGIGLEAVAEALSHG